MAVRNPWWLSDPAERYWMEITHRPDEDIGTNLWCPVRDVWSDELVSFVAPGDRILHWKAWQTGARPALLGWSEAASAPFTRRMNYYEDGGPAVPCWRVRLGGLRTFAQPVTSDSLLPRLGRLMRLRTRLERAYGKPIYFPFFRYGRDEIRAQQGYFAKFPAALFELIPEIGSARSEAL